MKTNVFVHWGSHFMTTDICEAINYYLYECGITLEDYAVDNEIVDCLDVDENGELTEELTDAQKDECFGSIICDMEEDCDSDGWEIKEIDVYQ